MSNITFSEKAWEHYLYWQINDKRMLKKINELLKDIQRNGCLNGIGKPKKLKYRKEYSRRIDKENRLIYNILEDENNIIVISCKGHYED